MKHINEKCVTRRGLFKVVAGGTATVVGVAAFHPDADELVPDTQPDLGMTILAPDTSRGHLRWGDRAP